MCWRNKSSLQLLQKIGMKISFSNSSVQPGHIAISRTNSGVVRVEDAKGQPPGIPFWLGEAPARTAELSNAVSDLRAEIEKQLSVGEADSFTYKISEWLAKELQLPQSAAEQIADYFADTYRSLGVIPSPETLVMERFFDESGGMQLLLHAPL